MSKGLSESVKRILVSVFDASVAGNQVAGQR